MSLTERLLTLYRVDSQVRGLRSRLDSARRYLDAQQKRVDELEQQKGELEARKRQTQAKIANFESETSTIDERISKLRDELNAASTNKQYSALLNEVNQLKAKRSETESRALEQMEAVDELDAELDRVAGELREREAIRDRAKGELEERRADVGDRLAELEGERDAAAAEIPKDELEEFNELAETYDGEAMAQVQEIDRRRREYACGACNIHLPIEVVSNLLGGGDQIVRCPACRRILHLHEETRGALVKK